MQTTTTTNSFEVSQMTLQQQPQQPPQPSPPLANASVATVVVAVALPPIRPFPTEAQLRWAQFHHGRSQIQQQERIQQLYRLPHNMYEVPNTISSDFDGLLGDDDEEDDNDDGKERANHHYRQKRRPPHISKGRQILLRVSQRHYEERRHQIRTEGFWYIINHDDDDDDDDDDDQLHSNRNDNDEKKTNHDSYSDDLLDAIFAETKQIQRTTIVNQQRRRRQFTQQRRRRRPTGNMTDTTDTDDIDTDRIRRFEAAFYALLSSLAAMEAKRNEYDQQHQHQLTSTNTKKWTRPSGVAVHTTIDGREYSDLKWGIVAASTSTTTTLPCHTTTTTTVSSMDHYNDDDNNITTSGRDSRTSSSWMIHIPPKDITTMSTPTPPNTFTSDLRLHLQDVARHYLRNNNNNNNDDENEKVANDNDDDDDVVSFVECFERHIADTATTKVATTSANINDSNDTQETMDMKRPNHMSSNDIASFVAKYEQQHQQRQYRHGAADTTASADTVQQPMIVSPITTMTKATTTTTTTAVVDWMSRLDNPLERDGFVQRFVSEMERVIAKQLMMRDGGMVVSSKSSAAAGGITSTSTALISADGKFHKPTFARLIQRYLLSLSSSSSSSVFSDQLLRHSFKNNYSTLDLESDEYNSVTLDDNDDEDEMETGVSSRKNNTINQQQVSKFVQIFMDQLDQEEQFRCSGSLLDNSNDHNQDISTGKNRNSNTTTTTTIIAGDGTLNRTVLEQVMSHCIDEARKRILVPDGNENYQMQDDTRLALLPESSEAGLQLQPPISGITNDNHDDITATTPARSTATTSSDVFDRIRNVSATMKRLRFGAPDISRATPPPHFPTMQDDTHEEIPKSSISNNIVETVSSKVSALFHSLNMNHTTDEAAYMAFREIQDQKRRSSVDPPATTATNYNHADGDVSSQSSFRVLPRGIRNVVKGLRNITAAQHRYRLGSDGEHKLEIEVDDGVDENDTNLFDDVESAAEFTRDGGSGDVDQQQLLGLSAGISGSMDTDGSTISGTGQHATNTERAAGLASIMLSPTLLTKRHQQAFRAVESYNWAQVKYLLSANPWLAEMADVNTNQYMLHKVAFYGSGQLGIDHVTGEVISVRHIPAPDNINLDLVNLFPSSVHKLDHDGNLPLHMAALSANMPMIQLLGEKFSSGASVRNEDGMLPLHLVIIACASPVAVTIASTVEPVDAVRAVLDYFPGAIGVTDNEGNLPIHTATSVLRGSQGAIIISLLLDEAEKRVSGPTFLRFRSKIPMDELYDESMETGTEVSQSDSSIHGDESTNCLLVTNDTGCTPLLLAIYSHAGWEVIEPLLRAQASIFSLDSENNNALHLLVSEEYKDPAVALKVLSERPDAATVRNDMGMLPIEVACMQMLPREVILALVLVDLPINLDTLEAPLVKDGYGASWWYLVCECDDYYVNIVEEVVSFCSFPEVRSLCLLRNVSGDVLLTRATPKCKNILDCSLRIIGRFEFVDSLPIFTDAAFGIEAFTALDFGTPINPVSEGKRVILKCFTLEQSYLNETARMRDLKVSSSHFEETLTFAVGSADSNRGPLPADGLRRYFISVESPKLTLDAVVRGMLNNHGCQTDTLVRQRYSGKIFSVLRLIAIALQQLHDQGFVHGNLSLENCAKYDDKWKLRHILGAKKVGDKLDYTTETYALPPEALYCSSHRGSRGETVLKSDFVARPSVDLWAFGKVAYEALAGQAMISLNENNDNTELLSVLLLWNDASVVKVKRELERIGIIESGIDLIALCLAPNEVDRKSIGALLQHPFWSNL